MPMIDTILLLHGYSVRTLNSWGKLPALLQAEGFEAASLFYTAFVSLDDYVSCDDLSTALEYQMSALETKGLDLSTTALVAHSTGSIIARRWMLDRRKKGSTSLSHFISCAGANHGSTLAQLGRGGLARIFRHITESSSVGQRVLTDLDYGSDFLRRLNSEWLEAWNDPKSPLCDETFCFSLGGTDHAYWQNQLTWQSRECGSDGTVRISASNLNYRIISVEPPYNMMTTRMLRRPAPHLIVETDKKYSHTSESQPDTLGLVMSKAENAINEITHFGRAPEPISATAFGILEGIASANERPFVALKEAMGVTDRPSYEALAKTWAAESSAWTSKNPDEGCSTIVVTMHDVNGRLADDSLVLIRDEDDGTIGGVSASVLGNQPIRNETSPSVLSYYVRSAVFSQVHPHSIYAEAKTDSAYVSYDLRIQSPLSDGPNPQSHVTAPNEFTYVDITTTRDASGALKFYPADLPDIASILEKPFPPFP